VRLKNQKLKIKNQNDNVKCEKFCLCNLPVLGPIDSKNTNGKNNDKAIFFNFDLSFLFFHFDI
jgi:hypothetical protein